MSRTLSKLCLPFDQATPEVRFLKAIKQLQNNVSLPSIIVWWLARPALFRGYLMDFKKCTSGVAWSKGRQHLESVRSPSRKISTSHLFWLVQTWSKLFTPVLICSHLFASVHTCSRLFTPIHTCSYLRDYLGFDLYFFLWTLGLRARCKNSKPEGFTHLISSFGVLACTFIIV